MMMRMFGGVVVVVLIAGVFLVSQAAYIVNETNQAVITQLGQFIRSDTQPGLYFKVPFYQTVVHFDKRILSNDTPPAEYLTLDKKRMAVDAITRWRVVDPFRFFVSLRDESNARARLDDFVLSELREALAQHEFAGIIAEKREPIMESVTQRVAERAKDFGIEVVDVRIKRADLPQEVQNSVFARMVAERSRIASRYRSEGAEESAKIRAEADKERTIMLARAYEESQRLRGEGDAQATSIYAGALGRDPEFYSFTRSLEAYEKFLNNETTLVMSTSSDLFRYLAGHRQGQEAIPAAAPAPALPMPAPAAPAPAPPAPAPAQPAPAQP
jgi:modulator of FtsH protease HflC